MRGSLTQRSAGSWTLTFDIGYASGRRRQHRETIHGTRRDAERFLAQRLHELDQRRLPVRPHISFNDLADRFLRERAIRVAPTTLNVYKRRLEQHVRPFLGDLQIERITAPDIEHVLSCARDRSRTQRNGQSVSSGTLRNLLITIRACLQYGMRNEWLTRNVATSVQMPSEESEREPILFDKALLQRLACAVKGTEIADEVLFALGTGARRGEICGLRWGDIDLERGWYTIRRNAIHIDREVRYRAPKSKASRRTDALPAAVLRLLTARRQDQHRLFATLRLGKIDENTAVFTRADGLPWDPNELSRQFSRLARRHGLQPMRFHDLRHAHASLAFAAGVPLHTISLCLGHSSDAITAKVYVHLLAEAREDKARRIDGCLRYTLPTQGWF